MTWLTALAAFALAFIAAAFTTLALAVVVQALASAWPSRRR